MAASSASTAGVTGNQRRVFVVGVGMTAFEKPGGRDWDYPDMGKEAVTRALADVGLPYSVIEQAAVGYCYGDSTCGQKALYGVGITGIPIYNVNNNCSTGSTALYMGYQFIRGGNDCVLAMGFEKMEKGSLKAKYEDRTNPMDRHGMIMAETHGFTAAPGAAQMFGNAGREHMKLYGTKLEHFAKIAEKNHRHSANNPYSQFKDIYTLEQIMQSPKVHEPLTKLQCCPTSDGAGAAILCSENFVYKYGLQNQAVEIIGMSMATDTPSTFQEEDKERAMIRVVGFDMTTKAAGEVYRQSGLTAKDVQVIELHDCFSANELLTYEALGLCPIGGAGALIDAGDVTYGGRWVVNPSGGLISKGHPLGATGLAQCAELNWQLRGLAQKRQVPNCKVALQHNLGLGGAAVVTMYRKASFGPAPVITGPRRADSVGVAPVGVPAGIAPAVLIAPAPKPAKKVASAPPAASASSGSVAGGSAAAVFADLKKRLTPELVKKIQVVYRFDLDGKSYLVDLKNGNGDIRQAEEKADCIMIMKEEDFVKLMAGKLDAQAAFMKGAIKIKGNMMLAQKLQLLTKPQAAL